MRRKASKINGKSARDRRPPKAKVGRSNRLGCATLPLPKQNQVIEIPQGYDVVERITFVDFEPKRTLLLRRKDAFLFENDLKSRRSGFTRSRSA